MHTTVVRAIVAGANGLHANVDLSIPTTKPPSCTLQTHLYVMVFFSSGIETDNNNNFHVNLHSMQVNKFIGVMNYNYKTIDDIKMRRYIVLYFCAVY
jgi:hypothetical protein